MRSVRWQLPYIKLKIENGKFLSRRGCMWSTTITHRHQRQLKNHHLSQLVFHSSVGLCSWLFQPPRWNGAFGASRQRRSGTEGVGGTTPNRLKSALLVDFLDLEVIRIGFRNRTLQVGQFIIQFSCFPKDGLIIRVLRKKTGSNNATLPFFVS